MAYRAEFRAEVVAYALRYNKAQAARTYGLGRATVLRWIREAEVTGGPALSLPSPAAVVEEPDLPVSLRARRPRGVRAAVGDLGSAVREVEAEAGRRGVSVAAVVGELFGGVFLPNGEPVPDLSLVYRIAGVEDLGRTHMVESSKTRTRGTGNASLQKGRTGRTQSKDRREGEHA